MGGGRYGVSDVVGGISAEEDIQIADPEAMCNLCLI